MKTSYTVIIGASLLGLGFILGSSTRFDKPKVLKTNNGFVPVIVHYQKEDGSRSTGFFQVDKYTSTGTVVETSTPLGENGKEWMIEIGNDVYRCSPMTK